MYAQLAIAAPSNPEATVSQKSTSDLLETLTFQTTTPMLLCKKVPPGLPDTIRRGSIMLSPVAVILSLSHVLRMAFNVKLHVIFIALAAIVSIPIVIWLRLFLWRLRVRLAVKRTGTVLPPSWDGRSFGNYDLLQYALERFHNGYPGE